MMLSAFDPPLPRKRDPELPRTAPEPRLITDADVSEAIARWTQAINGGDVIEELDPDAMSSLIAHGDAADIGRYVLRQRKLLIARLAARQLYPGAEYPFICRVAEQLVREELS